MRTLLIDADVVAYNAAFACERASMTSIEWNTFWFLHLLRPWTRIKQHRR